jgi:hypothetical protein
MIRHQWKFSLLTLMSVAPIAALSLLTAPAQAQTTAQSTAVTPGMNTELQPVNQQQGESSSGFVEVNQGRLRILVASPHLRKVCQSHCNTCQCRCNTCQCG